MTWNEPQLAAASASQNHSSLVRRPRIDRFLEGVGYWFPAQEVPMDKMKRSLGRQQAVSTYRRRFSEDFKRVAVRLVVEEKYTFVATTN